MNIPNNQMHEQKTESAAKKSVRFTADKYDSPKEFCKRKLDVDQCDKKQPYKRSKKHFHRQEKIDLLLVDALTKSEDVSTQKTEVRSSNQLFCDSIVDILDKLPPKRNRMARVEIQNILIKYEFDDEH